MPQVVARIAHQAAELRAVSLTRAGAAAATRRSNVTAELGDLLYYANDILCLPDDLELLELRGVQGLGADGGGLGLRARTQRQLWRAFIEPRLLRALVGRGGGEGGSGAGRGGIAACETAAGDSAGGGGEGGGDGEVTALFVLSRLAASCSHQGTLRDVTAAMLHPSGGEGGVGGRHNPYRAALLAALRGQDCDGGGGGGGGRGGGAVREDLAVAAIALLTSLLKARSADEAALEAGGALPTRRRCTKALLKELTGGASSSDGGGWAGGDGGAALGGHARSKSIGFDVEGLSFDSDADSAAKAEAAAVARAELVGAMVAMIARRAPGPPATAQQSAAWVLRRLVPTPGGEGGGGEEDGGLTGAQWEALDAARAAAAAAVRGELDGPWGDAAGPLMAQEWGMVRRGMESPVTQDDAVVAALQEAAGAAAGGDDRDGGETSAAAGVRLIDAVRSLSLLTSLLGALQSGAEPPVDVHPLLGDPAAAAAALRGPRGLIPEPLPVPTAAEIEICEGSEVMLPADPPAAAAAARDDPVPALIACRVAFEAGRERAVFLTVAARSHAACVSVSMLLAEEAAPGDAAVAGQTHGIVRAVAPIAGCRATVDEAHSKWLHVRVRSPLSCVVAMARSPPGAAAAATLRRRLQDGHWTLAFSDEETCAAAKRMIDGSAELLRAACLVTLAPLL